MKLTHSLVVFFIFIFLVKLNAQNYGLDNANSQLFSKYRIPDTKLNLFSLGSSLSFNSQKHNEVNNSDSYNSYNSSFYFYFNPRYFILQETDKNYLSLNAILNSGYGHSSYKSQYSSNEFINTDKRNQYNTRINSNFDFNIYLNKSSFFYSVGSDILVDLTDTKEVKSNNGVSSDIYLSNKSQSYNFNFGFGFGKIRDVTPIVSAIRFQERLKQLNLLNTNLSDKTIEDLAQQFSRRVYYGQIYDRPEKYFWDGIEKTLMDDGVSFQGLNLYADSYLKETLNEVRFLRREGFWTGINAKINYNNNYSSRSQNGFILNEQLFTLANFYAEYSHQLNLKSQINFKLSLSGGPNVLNNPSVSQKYSISASAGYNYELTDRLLISSIDQFDLSFYNSAVQEKTLNNQFSIGLNYFIEDNISLNANYSWYYEVNKRYVNPGQKIDTNSHNINIGFTYYFNKALVI